MDKLESLKEKLQITLINLRKSVNRPYSEKTIREKRELIEQTLIDAKSTEQNIRTDVKTATLIKGVCKEIQQLSAEILSILDKQQLGNMAFDIKTATALVKYFDGNPEETESFIESVSLLNELTPVEHKGILLKFVKTRITGKAKYMVSEELNTITKLTDKLRVKFSIKISSDAVLAQLKSCKQGNTKLTDFTNKIEDLSRQLTRAFISEKVAEGETAEKLAEKFAMQTIAENVSNSETSLILRAGNLTNLSDTIAKAIAVDKPIPKNVYHYKTNRRGNNHNNNFNNQNRRNNQSFNNTANRNSYENFNRNNTPNRNQNYNRNQNNRFRNNNNNYRRPFWNNSNNRQNINHLSSGESQPPQSVLETNQNRLGGNQ